MTDREIADLFRAAHRSAGAQIPFARVLAGAHARAARRHGWRGSAPRLALASAGVLVLALLAYVRSGSSPLAEAPPARWEAPTDFLLAGAEFTSPTDFLLGTPGLDSKGLPE